MRTIIDIIEDAVELSRGRPVLAFDDRPGYTADEFIAKTAACAGFLQTYGVEQGERVALLVGNRCEFVWALFGCVYAGVVPVPLNTSLKGPILDAMLHKVEPRVVIVDATTATAARESLQRVGIQPLVFDVDDAAGSCDSVLLSAAIESGDPGRRLVSRPDELALIMFTSGTTGPSKGIMYSHGMALEFAEFGEYLFDFDADDVMYNCLPLFHGNALLLTTLGALRFGGRAVIGTTFSASTYWQNVAATGATILSLLGTMFPILWNRPPSPDDTNHHARIGLTVPAPKQYVPQFQDRFGLKLTSLYGLTDVGMPVGVPHWMDGRPGQAGIVHPDWECQVVDEHGEKLPAGVPGQMVFRPLRPNISQLGYWRDAEGSLALRKNMWFQSGDILVEDEDGWFTFVDRQKDAIRRSGENVSSFEVEMVLQGHPAVAEVAVYGLPSDVGEDEVAAAVVLVESEACTEQDLVDFAEIHLPYFAVPRYVFIVTELPKTPTAKVRKDELRRAGLDLGPFDAGPRGRRALAERDGAART
jgi:crotonobetaine/carnitine-CoA ligase